MRAHTIFVGHDKIAHNHDGQSNENSWKTLSFDSVFKNDYYYIYKQNSRSRLVFCAHICHLIGSNNAGANFAFL